MAIKPRIKIKKKASVGEVISIRTKINHRMESGQRIDKDTNEKIPRMIIHTFEASFNGKEIITFNLEGSVSADPYFEFFLKVPEAGELLCKWTDDEGSIFEATKTLAIS